MNILVVTPAYPIVNRPDLVQDTKAVHYFTREWVKAGHNVNVFHMHFHTFKDIRKYKFEYGWKISQTELDGVKIFMMENRFFSRLKNLTKIQKLIASINFNKIIKTINKPDVILVHMPSELNDFYDKLNPDCARIAVLHNTDINKLQRKQIGISDLVDKFDAFGFRSKNIKNTFNKLINYEKRQFMVHSGAPDFGINKYKEKPSGTFKVLFVGKLITLKKVNVILNALAKLGKKFDYHFNVIGSGEERGSLEILTTSLGLKEKVEFLGELPRNKVIEKMRESDIFVMVSSPETFGLVYIEAMAMGCITIGSKGEGIDGVIDHNENGFLVEPGNVVMLERCLQMISEMDEINYRNISKNAIKTAQTLTEKSVADFYINNVKEIVEDYTNNNIIK